MREVFQNKWILLSSYMILIIASFTYGIVATHGAHLSYTLYLDLLGIERRTDKTGVWHQVRDAALSDEQKEKIKRLETLPYLKGYQPATTSESVTTFDEEATYPGVNLVLSADEPKAFLMDMEGNVLHTWRKEFSEIWPEDRDIRLREQTFWRRVHLFDNGDLLAIFEGFGLIKLDKHSNLLWAYKGACHHDLFVKDGNIYVLMNKMVQDHGLDTVLELESQPFDGRPVAEDYITILTPDGEEIKTVSIIKSFLNSEYAPFLEHIKYASDILHTNTIEPINRDIDPLFKKGQILISMRKIHAIAVIDPDQEKVTWGMTGMWKFQHEPRLLENGNILLFDNSGNQGKSQAIEFNPMTREVVWTFKGDPPDSFYSRWAGTLQRLPNGNTLLVESTNGRAFEVTRSGKIIWEYHNPNRAGEKDELIAALYDVIRVDPQQVRWLNAKSQ